MLAHQAAWWLGLPLAYLFWRARKDAGVRYVPIEPAPAFRYFLRLCQPKPALVMEIELWPVMIMQTKRAASSPPPAATTATTAEAMRVVQAQGLFVVPPFHKELLRGVSSYGFEFLAAHPDLDTIYATGADRIIAVSDDPVANAMRAYYTDIHNLAEGAGAAPLAGPMQERIRMQGKKVGVIVGRRQHRYRLVCQGADGPNPDAIGPFWPNSGNIPQNIVKMPCNAFKLNKTCLF